MNNITKAIKKHNKSVWELGEFDGWVNEATRADLNEYYKQGGHFGIKNSTGKMEIVENLQDALNFSVDYVFRAEDTEKVKLLYAGYRADTRGKEWNGEVKDRTWEYIRALDKLAVYSCAWV